MHFINGVINMLDQILKIKIKIVDKVSFGGIKIIKLFSIEQKIGTKKGKVINTNKAFINRFCIHSSNSFACSIN